MILSFSQNLSNSKRLFRNFQGKKNHLLLLDLLCQAFQHYLLTSHHTLQCTILQCEQEFPDEKYKSNINGSKKKSTVWIDFVKAEESTCSADFWNALYNALTIYPWSSEALLIATIRARHTSSFTKFPAY